MSAASEFDNYFIAAAKDFPFTPITLYCRILLIVDRSLKNNTEIPYSKHSYISKYFASLWRNFYENKNASPDTKDYLISIDYNVISVGELISINNFIDSQIRALIKSNQNIVKSGAVLDLSFIGDIAFKVKKVILDHNKYWSPTTQSVFNDHSSQKAKKIYEKLTYSVNQRVG